MAFDRQQLQRYGTLYVVSARHSEVTGFHKAIVLEASLDEVDTRQLLSSSTRLSIRPAAVACRRAWCLDKGAYDIGQQNAFRLWKPIIKYLSNEVVNTSW